jgi:ribosomal protein L29
MASKNIKTVLGLTKEEAKQQLGAAEKEIFQLRLKKSTLQLQDVSSIWKTRKLIARLKTRLGLLNEKV